MRTLIFTFLATLAGSRLAFSGESLSSEVLLPGYEATEACKPVMVYGKDVYLLAWQAGRNEQANIVGLRLDQSGKPMEAKPFIISAAQDTQERPRIAFGGGVFFVVWHDLRKGKDWDVYGARVTSEGKVLDPDGIAVAAAERNQCEPGVVWDGKNFQVLWRGFQGETSDIVSQACLPKAGYHIFGGRISGEGKALDGAGVFMAQPWKGNVTPLGMGMATATLLPEGKLLATARTGKTQCLWRIADGKPVTAPVLVGFPGKLDVNVLTGFDDQVFASNGKSVLIVWTTFLDAGGRSGGADNSGMIVLGADGEIGAALPQALGNTTNYKGAGRNAGRHPAPAWDGKRYVVAWDVPRQGKEFNYEALVMRTFASDGKPLGNDATVVDDPESPAYWPAVASDGAGTTMVAYERHPKTPDQAIRIALRMVK